MTDIRMADVSEFQSNVDAPAYLKAGYQCIICRTHNGNRPDHMMTARRDYLRRHPFVAIGWYQYLVASRDAAAQAHEFINGLGGLRENEYVICDAESGGGAQTGHVRAWFAVVDRWAGFPGTLYSGDSFLKNQLGGSGSWKGRPIWVAAYGQSEPSQAHTLWQYTDNFHFPGITGGSDCSIHHDTAFEFLSAMRSGHVPKHPTPPPAPKPAPPKGEPKGKARLLLECDLANLQWTMEPQEGQVVWREQEQYASLEVQLGVGGSIRGHWRKQPLEFNAEPLGKP